MPSTTTPQKSIGSLKLAYIRFSFFAGVVRPLITAMITAWRSRELFFNLYMLFGLDIDLKIDCINGTLPSPRAVADENCTLALENWQFSEVVSTILFPAACLIVLLPSRFRAIRRANKAMLHSIHAQAIDFEPPLPKPEYSLLDHAGYWATAFTCMLGAAVGVVSTLLNKLSDSHHDTSINIFEVFPLHVSLPVGIAAMLLAYPPFAAFVGGVYEHNLYIESIIQKDPKLRQLNNKLGYRGMLRNIANPRSWDISAWITTEANYLFPAIHALKAFLGIFMGKSQSTLAANILAATLLVLGQRISVYGRIFLRQIGDEPDAANVRRGIKELRTASACVIATLYKCRKDGDVKDAQKAFEDALKETKEELFNHIISNGTANGGNVTPPNGALNGHHNGAKKNGAFNTLTFFHDKAEEKYHKAVGFRMEHPIQDALSKKISHATEQKNYQPSRCQHIALSSMYLFLGIDFFQYFFNTTQAVIALLQLPIELSKDSANTTYNAFSPEATISFAIISAFLTMMSMMYFYTYSIRPAYKGLIEATAPCFQPAEPEEEELGLLNGDDATNNTRNHGTFGSRVATPALLAG
ncbi:MAG: hypothetical protein CMF39_00380 [Legionellaceae bacterium]|nr:hypothetical protein [Legionellaceae bacterium]